MEWRKWTSIELQSMQSEVQNIPAAVGVEEATKREFHSGTETATDNDMDPVSSSLSYKDRWHWATILNSTRAFDN